MECIVHPQGTASSALRARIAYVYPTLKEGVRYGVARIVLNNPDLAPKPGMYADIRIELPQSTKPDDKALALPREAITRRGDSSWVFVMINTSHFDLYWARSRVLEYLDQIRASLPNDTSLRVGLGPDATGVGWVYQYALRSSKHEGQRGWRRCALSRTASAVPSTRRI
jgi:hypothetical protein